MDEELPKLTDDEGRRPSSPASNDRANEDPTTENEDGGESLALPTLYAKAALATDEVRAAPAGGTCADKARRVVHFTKPQRCKSGLWIFDRVVVMSPGHQVWIAQTIDEATGKFDVWECFGPLVDPFDALQAIGQKVVSWEIEDDTAGGWGKWWRQRHPRPIRTSVDLAQRLLQVEIPRAKEPHELRDWLLGHQPVGRQKSAKRAAWVGIREQLRDMVSEV